MAAPVANDLNNLLFDVDNSTVYVHIEFAKKYLNKKKPTEIVSILADIVLKSSDEHLIPLKGRVSENIRCLKVGVLKQFGWQEAKNRIEGPCKLL